MSLPPPDPAGPAWTDLPPPPVGDLVGTASEPTSDDAPATVIDAVPPAPPTDGPGEAVDPVFAGDVDPEPAPSTVVEPDPEPEPDAPEEAWGTSGAVDPLIGTTVASTAPPVATVSASASSGPPDEPAPPKQHRGLATRWGLPIWGWLILGALIAGGAVAAVVTRPDDSTKELASLRSQLQDKDADLAQVEADAQQSAFDDVQEVRDEAEKQLSDAASAKEQAQQAQEQSDAKLAELVAFEVGRVQAEAVAAACTAADAAGYAQTAAPDASTFGPAAATGLPADVSAQVLASLDNAAIQAKVDECFQTGSARYLSQTTTTTTLPPETVPPDPVESAIDPASTPS
jgi:hypothetical protein